MSIALMIVQLLCALFLIVVIMLQSGKNSGLGGSFGQSQTGFGAQAKSKTWDAKFARMTKWVALAFVLLTLVLFLLPKNQTATVASADQIESAELADY